MLQHPLNHLSFSIVLIGPSTIDYVVLYNALSDTERESKLRKDRNGYTKDRIDADRILNDQKSTCQTGVDPDLILGMARRKSSINQELSFPLLLVSIQRYG